MTRSPGAVLGNSRWIGWAAATVLVIVLLKVALIVLGGFGIRHRKAANAGKEHERRAARAAHR